MRSLLYRSSRETNSSGHRAQLTLAKMGQAEVSSTGSKYSVLQEICEARPKRTQGIEISFMVAKFENSTSQICTIALNFKSKCKSEVFHVLPCLPHSVSIR